MKKLALTLLILVMAIGTFALTGCGDKGGGIASEPEPIINPITGKEVESLPARPVMVAIPND
ncbi:MAG: hypothetical protein PHS19_04785, partial [Eubacteriales bacterium]|nr:hypothetical protein [Eubacteriales bacterium]